MRSVVRAARCVGAALAVIVAPVLVLAIAEMASFWIGNNWWFGATSPDAIAVQDLVLAVGFVGYLTVVVTVAWLCFRRRRRETGVALDRTRFLARRFARGYVWLAFGLIVSVVAAKVWWGAWMYDGWPRPPELLRWIDSGCGEGAGVRIELEMMICAFTAWIAVSAVGRLGLASWHRSGRTFRTA